MHYFAYSSSMLTVLVTLRCYASLITAPPQFDLFRLCHDPQAERDKSDPGRHAEAERFAQNDYADDRRGGGTECQEDRHPCRYGTAEREEPKEIPDAAADSDE